MSQHKMFSAFNKTTSSTPNSLLLEIKYRDVNIVFYPNFFLVENTEKSQQTPKKYL